MAEAQSSVRRDFFALEVTGAGWCWSLWIVGLTCCLSILIQHVC